MRLIRCVPCLALLASIMLASFAVHAQAQGGPLASVSSDALLSMIGALLMALLAGYARGLQQRIRAVELEQNQMRTEISLFRETVLERHPTRPELAQMRADMRDGFDEVKQLIRERR